MIFSVHNLRRRSGAPTRTAAAAVSLVGTAIAAAAPIFGQTKDDTPLPVTRGIYNFVRTTGDAEQEFEFFERVFGLELERSTFAGTGQDAPPPRIVPIEEARSDRLVANLTATEGARFRTVFMRAPNTPFGLELSEFFDISRDERPANAWDPGASMLIFRVGDLAAIVDRLAEAGAPVVTIGGAPLDTRAGKSILVRSPDGYLIRVIQASTAEIAAAAEAGDIVTTSIGISVANAADALRYYRDLLGFEIGATRMATVAELRLHGLVDGALGETTAVIPGTGVAVFIAEFELHGTAPVPAHAYHWRIQDVGAPQFQLQVAGLDALIERTREAGYGFLSIRGEPIERPFGRFVFATDADGILVEYVEPASVRQIE